LSIRELDRESAFLLRYRISFEKERTMAKYSKKASDEVGKAMREKKKGTLKSGKSGKKVKNPKQAIAIGLSKARKKGAKVPKKSSSKKK
jgi:hypothetical protein